MLKNKRELECELSVDLEVTTAGKALHSAICSPKDLPLQPSAHGEQEREQWEVHQQRCNKRQHEEQERQRREQYMMGCTLPEI
jgi:hypothetical protein